MADVSPEDVRWALEAHERRTDAIHADLGQRITQVARDAVQGVVWQTAQQSWAETIARLEREHDQEVARLEREHERDIKAVRAELAAKDTAVRGELKELRDRPQLTLGRIAVLATAVIALLALVVQAYGTLKGAK